MADISIPKIILFDIGVSQDYRGQILRAETVLKDIFIEFDDPCTDAVQLTFCVWFRIRPKKDDDFEMEAYIQQQYNVAPIDQITPADLHSCVTNCSDKLKEMINLLYRESGNAPLVIPMRYDEVFFQEQVEKIRFQALGASFDFGSILN